MGIVCMAMIWTLFVDPIDAKNHWGCASIQLAFTIFVVTETWLVPIEAWFVDKYGSSIVVMFGGVMISVAWVLNSRADSLTMLYAARSATGKRGELSCASFFPPKLGIPDTRRPPERSQRADRSGPSAGNTSVLLTYYKHFSSWSRNDFGVDNWHYVYQNCR